MISGCSDGKHKRSTLVIVIMIIAIIIMIALDVGESLAGSLPSHLGCAIRNQTGIYLSASLHAGEAIGLQGNGGLEHQRSQPCDWPPSTPVSPGKGTRKIERDSLVIEGCLEQ